MGEGSDDRGQKGISYQLVARRRVRVLKHTREGLARSTTELGLKLDSKALEALFRRLHSLSEALDVLEELVEPALEPFPTVTLPEDE